MVRKPPVTHELDSQIRELEPVLLRFAFRATRNQDVARDLTQEALLAAVEGRFEGRSTLRTWVIGILSHKIADHFRAGTRRPEGADDPDLVATASSRDVDRVAMARQKLASVERALGELPERERLALLLVDVEGAERQEAEAALGVSAENLRVLLHRGRNRLRRLLEQ